MDAFPVWVRWGHAVVPIELVKNSFHIVCLSIGVHGLFILSVFFSFCFQEDGEMILC